MVQEKQIIASMDLKNYIKEFEKKHGFTIDKKTLKNLVLDL
jgi:hypothetical protein